jgi:hypothetical protein
MVTSLADFGNKMTVLATTSSILLVAIVAVVVAADRG